MIETIEAEKKKGVEVSLGTTIISVVFKDGVILGADTRTSMGTYVSNRVSKKITNLAEGIYVCRSGSAADTQEVAGIVAGILREQLVCYNEKPTVKDAAVLAKKIIFQNPHLLAGLIVAGVDSTGPHIYTITLGGTILEQNYALAGSGSIYITGLCDNTYKEEMSREEAIDFVKTLVSHAIYRDNSSGGCIRMMVITKEKEEELFVAGDSLTIQ
ncbi:20S proteasome subunit beta 1 [Nematocida sp. AWRm77]|nr:20S proteasome subunit beta 1 [Nematocida sp. AWRm77]